MIKNGWRWILLAGLLVMPMASQAAKAGVAIKNVRPEFLEEAYFKRISEYFTGKENPGRRLFLRSQDARTGLYFIFDLSHRASDLPAGSQIKLELVDTVNNEPRQFSFTVPGDRRSKALFLGLTGTDWPDANVRPLAWKLTLVDANGAALAIHESYLWKFPADESAK